MSYKKRTENMAVIGTGVIGLNSALYLKQNYRDVNLTVISDKDINEITSIGPPGLFHPFVPNDNLT